MPEPTTPSGGTLPPPGPPGLADTPGSATPWHDPEGPGHSTEPVAGTMARPPRPGQLTMPWRAMVVATWIGVFVAYMAVWKASEELGIATWWLGPRSSPQPLLIRLVPFFVTAGFGILASYNVRRLPAIGLVGAVVLAGIAVPDLSRSTGLAVIEFTIAGAVLLVSAASFTGMYRRPSSDAAG